MGLFSFIKKVDFNNNLQPNTSSLSPVEVLFLNYINGRNTQNPNIAGYWTYEYNLNYKKVIDKLINNGYIKESDYKFNISKLKIDELKKMLINRSLKTTGKKAELIKRILDNYSEEECKKLFNQSFFQLTEKAVELLSHNKHILYIHSKKSYFAITVDAADKVKKLNPHYTEYDVALHILREDLGKHYKNKDWGLYRNVIYAISLVYGDLEEYELQLNSLFEICYRDLSGLSNSNHIDSKDLVCLAPGIINSIIRIQEKLSLSDQELKTKYLQLISKVKLAHHHYSNEQTWKLIYSEIK
ncbi:SAP domain-containing protein [Petroclostridium sp. X23]|uniref:SAP domain-containing protein n=1 Tax=Petroclostridium sp. X23 TaxID=3045146 RepID=UPI0024AD44C9|nr:SAP domain-containing protein [Petroclostridium sp. X23]WHH58274.1 SAP domain-containing protein [Petroclostridium sp. X23]